MKIIDKAAIALAFIALVAPRVFGAEEQGKASATLYKKDLAGNHVINVGYNGFFERNFSRQPSREA